MTTPVIAVTELAIFTAPPVFNAVGAAVVDDCCAEFAAVGFVA